MTPEQIFEDYQCLRRRNDPGQEVAPDIKPIDFCRVIACQDRCELHDLVEVPDRAGGFGVIEYKHEFLVRLAMATSDFPHRRNEYRKCPSREVVQLLMNGGASGSKVKPAQVYLTTGKNRESRWN